MYGLIIDSWIWGVLLLTVNAILLYINIKYRIHIKLQKKALVDYVKLMEKQTRLEFNKVAMMVPEKLEGYLKIVFAKSILLVINTYVSDRASTMDSTIYGKILATALANIGSDTLEAINYYYGKDYVIRWMELNYRVLEDNGFLIKVRNLEGKLTILQIIDEIKYL